MALRAYKVGDLLVFAPNGCVAKSLAAPQIKPSSEWAQNVSEWVSLMAERRVDLDALVDASVATPYIVEGNY